MRRTLAIFALPLLPPLAAACGRVDFEPAAHAVDAHSDAHGDAPAADFCASLAPQPAFCADFDGSASAALDWGSPGQLVLGGLVIDGSAATSPPASLLATIPAKTGSGDVTNAYLRHDFPGAPTDVTFAFDMRVDTKGQGGAVLAVLAFSNANVVHSIEYVYEPSDVQFEDVVSVSDVPTFTYYNLAVPSLGAWHHVTFRVQLAGSGAPRLSSTLDGAQVLDSALPTADAGSLAAELGVPYHAGSSSPWSVHFDSATVDAQ